MFMMVFGVLDLFRQIIEPMLKRILQLLWYFDQTAMLFHQNVHAFRVYFNILQSNRSPTEGAWLWLKGGEFDEVIEALPAAEVVIMADDDGPFL